MTKYFTSRILLLFIASFYISLVYNILFTEQLLNFFEILQIFQKLLIMCQKIYFFISFLEILKKNCKNFENFNILEIIFSFFIQNKFLKNVINFKNIFQNFKKIKKN